MAIKNYLWSPLWSSVWSPMLDFLLPPRCVCCGVILAESDGVCPPCWSKFKFLEQPLCHISGAPLPFAIEGAQTVSPLARRYPPAYDHARAALFYEGKAMELIRRMKFNDDPALAALLARWMRRAGAELLEGADYILPVPLHPRRLWARRFNQAAELGRHLSRATNIPMPIEWLRRRRWTSQQVGLSRSARRRNLRGAFRICPRAAEFLRDAHVVLVDDVMTTGSTLETCARVLRKAGARRIDALVAARVVLPEWVPRSDAERAAALAHVERKPRAKRPARGGGRIAYS